MKLLFIDTETNGLPLNKYAPYTSTEMWPHIIQISWQIVDFEQINKLTVLKEEDHFLTLRSTWNKDAECVHQIPESIVGKFGKDPAVILTSLFKDILICDFIIGHNLSFDKNVILAEVQRIYVTGNFPVSPSKFWFKKQEVCTMKISKSFCNIKFKDSNDIKFPKLNELYLKLFNIEYDISGANLHNSKHDVSCLISCFKEIIKREDHAFIELVNSLTA